MVRSPTVKQGCQIAYLFHYCLKWQFIFLAATTWHVGFCTLCTSLTKKLEWNSLVLEITVTETNVYYTKYSHVIEAYLPPYIPGIKGRHCYFKNKPLAFILTSIFQ